VTNTQRQENSSEFTDETDVLVAFAGTRNFIVVRDGLGDPPTLSACVLARNVATSLDVLSFQIALSPGRYRQFSICSSGENPIQPESLVEFADNAGNKVWSGLVSECPVINSEMARQALTKLGPSQRSDLLRFILEKCALRLPVNHDPGYPKFCRTILRYCDVPISPQPIWAKIGQKILFCSARSSDRVEHYSSAVVLQADHVKRLAHKPQVVTQSGKQFIDLLIEDPSIPGLKDDPNQVVVFSDKNCLIIPMISPMHAETENIFHVLEKSNDKEKQARIDNLFRALKPLIKSAPEVLGLIRELSLTNSREIRAAEVLDSSLGAGIDLAVATPNGGLFVAGWLADDHAMVEDIITRSPFGAKCSLDGNIWHYRSDETKSSLGEIGGRRTNRKYFLSYVENLKDPISAAQYEFDLRMKSGACTRLTAPKQSLDPVVTRQALLECVSVRELGEDILVNSLAPPIEQFQKLCMQGDRIEEVLDFGRSQKRPPRSIVIPLYENLNFLKFQIAALTMDPRLSSTEIVFVLDSPWQAEHLCDLLHGFSILYGRAFRLVIMTRNFGFAAACNAGAKESRGKDLLFLNSDVVPETSGWLSKMGGFATSKKLAGAVSPKLVFEDNSIQHAGMWFHEFADGSIWNDHFYKGFPSNYQDASFSRRVPAVTAACLLIANKTFNDVGGFSEDYVLGDFEDSDLCLKLHAKGLQSWYFSDARLYHFERQSFSGHLGHQGSIATHYNQWLHQNRWREEMLDITRQSNKWR
jgi:GT2 family glycosyltransferase